MLISLRAITTPILRRLDAGIMPLRFADYAAAYR